MAIRIISSQFSATSAKCSAIFNYTGSYQLPICTAHSEYSTFERTSNQVIKTTVNSRYSNYKQRLWNPPRASLQQEDGNLAEGLAGPRGTDTTDHGPRCTFPDRGPWLRPCARAVNIPHEVTLEAQQWVRRPRVLGRGRARLKSCLCLLLAF